MSAAKRKGACCRLAIHIPARPCIDWSRNRRGVLLLEGKHRGACRHATTLPAAQKFGISKSTVHKDLSERLPKFNRALYDQVKAVLDVNKAQRHIRGGMATRKKYKGI